MYVLSSKKKNALFQAIHPSNSAPTLDEPPAELVERGGRRSSAAVASLSPCPAQASPSISICLAWPWPWPDEMLPFHFFFGLLAHCTQLPLCIITSLSYYSFCTYVRTPRCNFPPDFSFGPNFHHTSLLTSPVASGRQLRISIHTSFFSYHFTIDPSNCPSDSILPSSCP